LFTTLFNISTQEQRWRQAETYYEADEQRGVTMLFQDRRDAGRKLAVRLAHYQRENCLVLALPRGGVPVGYEVAQELGKPLDILVVRKLGLPGQEELAVGAVGPEGVAVWNHEVLTYFGLVAERLQPLVDREQAELDRRLAVFRGSRPYPNLQGMTVILVDDGLATGASARAGILAVKAMGPSKVVLAVPVGAQSTVSELRPMVDELVCLEAPEYFQAVSAWYNDFSQTTDREVINLLHQSWEVEMQLP
jgi:putative phosphoribosyl transferase